MFATLCNFWQCWYYDIKFQPQASKYISGLYFVPSSFPFLPSTHIPLFSPLNCRPWVISGHKSPLFSFLRTFALIIQDLRKNTLLRIGLIPCSVFSLCGYNRNGKSVKCVVYSATTRCAPPQPRALFWNGCWDRSPKKDSFLCLVWAHCCRLSIEGVRVGREFIT